MSERSVLFLGGSGVISTAVVERARRNGWKVSVLNRGRSDRELAPDVERLTADLRGGEAAEVIGAREFDVVIDFIAFTPDQLAADLDLVRNRTGHFLFISSASAYQKPPMRLPVTESTPLRNPFWQYSRDKIACEDILMAQYREHGTPVTIIRPSHSYDRTLLPFGGGWTVVERMRRGLPVVVHGDGTTPWTITHVRDVAVGIAGLFGRQDVVGEAYHITGDEAPSWNEIYQSVGRAAGVDPHLVHVASEAIARIDPEEGPGLLGDKSFPMTFDNSKIKAAVPEFRQTVSFADGAREIVEWYDSTPGVRVIDENVMRIQDEIIARYVG